MLPGKFQWIEELTNLDNSFPLSLDQKEEMLHFSAVFMYNIWMTRNKLRLGDKIETWEVIGKSIQVQASRYWRAALNRKLKKAKGEFGWEELERREEKGKEKKGGEERKERERNGRGKYDFPPNSFFPGNPRLDSEKAQILPANSFLPKICLKHISSSPRSQPLSEEESQFSVEGLSKESSLNLLEVDELLSCSSMVEDKNKILEEPYLFHRNRQLVGAEITIKEGGIKMEMMKWTATMDDTLVQALLNQHYAGNRVEGTFPPLAYSNIIKELKRTIKSMKTLKERVNECYDIFKNGRLSAFAWNPITKLWTAEPEVWDDLLRENPLAEKWKNKPISNYESMEELFAKDHATGEGDTTAKVKQKRWESEENGQQVNSIDEIDHLVSQNVIQLEEFAATPRSMNAQQQKKSDVQSCKKMKMLNDEKFDISLLCYNSESKKRKISNDEEEFDGLKGALHTVAEAIREDNSVMEKSRPNAYSEEDIFKQLVAIGIKSCIFSRYMGVDVYMVDNELILKEEEFKTEERV
ncbi:hypothetical protein M9H77_08677 [Catharanthus roseus]|uniref:Uncharacterized protein n=1 Tax=Catharanthus roseus TaxID=4058 RepID=A0ACC0BYQ2_CATRO|nr:hypothetical protein M9H77_08677 [Catharanthus roseus]